MNPPLPGNGPPGHVLGTQTRHPVWILLRALLGFALAAWLIRSMLMSCGVDLRAEFTHANKRWILLANGLYALTYVLTVMRWRMLLHAQGLRLPLSNVVRLVLVGNFFSLFVPGAVGGDVVKAVYLAGETPGHRVDALLTVFVDRVLGAIGLLVLAVVAVSLSYSFLSAADPRLGIGALTFVAVGILSALFLCALTWRDRWVPHAVRKVGSRVLPARVRSLARRSLEALDRYRTKPGVLAAGIAMSVGVHTLVTAVVILLAKSVGEQGGGLGVYLVAVQVANGIAMIPLTPGGVGGRDVVMCLLLKAAGVNAERAAVIPVMYTATFALWALVGGLVFVFDPVRTRRIRD